MLNQQSIGRKKDFKMDTIGIIGQGFVGTAIFEGMKHAFEIWAYDIKTGVTGWMGGKGFETSTGSSVESGFKQILAKCDIIFVCLPTPMNPDGTCNTKIVEDAVNMLDELNPGDHKVIVIKSTVPPGTTEGLNKTSGDWVCFNPEFLTERTSVEDFKNQDRIIIGGPREGTNVLKAMYEKAYPNVPVTKTSSTIAELVKYTTNCFLATKVAFANEVAQVCDSLDEDYDKVVEYATKDNRLGNSHWSVPGPDGKKGFGGSCFPKDLNAFIQMAGDLDVYCHTLQGAWQTNCKVRPEKDWEQLKGRAVT